MIAERPKSEAEALGRYGRSVGIAFQLVDDVLDYSARQAELGKSVGDDFRDGKVTLPIVLAIRAAAATRKRLSGAAAWRTRRSGDGDLERAMEIMTRHGTLDASLKQAERYAEEALRALNVFPDSPERQALAEVARFCVQRAY